MARLDIDGYNATFRTFVEFAQKTQKDGYDSACAKATFAGKRITVSPLSLHETSYVLRKTGEKTVNDSTRAIFRNAVAEMFGGEAKIPESVKKAMLLGDYGDGRPLTTRRIMAVKDAIDAEDSMREKGVSQFASPATREAALAKGYHPSELGRLANAVNYFMKATGASEEMALEVVATPGTRANLLMNCGGRFLKSAEAFADGLETTDLPADMQDEPAADVDPEVEALCGRVHTRQIAKVMEIVSESAPEDIGDKLADHGINGGQLPADRIFSKNEATGDVFIRYTTPKELKFRFEWSATVKLDGTVVVAPFQFADEDALAAETENAVAKINQGLRGHMKNGGARGVGDEACAAAARNLVNLAKDDSGLLQLLLENNGKAATYMLAESAFKFRTDEEIANRLNALRANVEELRMATNGDAQMFKLAIKMLAGLEGKPLAAGKLSRLFDAVGKLDLSPLTAKAGSARAGAHLSALNDIKTMLHDVIRESGAYRDMDVGRETEVSVNSIAFAAICSRLDEDTLRWLRDGLRSAEGVKVVEAVRLTAMEIVNDPEAGPEANEDAKTVARDLMGLVDNVFDHVLDFALGIENPEPRPELQDQLAQEDIRPIFDLLVDFAAKERPAGFREARENAQPAYSHFDHAVLDRTIARALDAVKGDADAAKLVVRHMELLLVRPNTTLRSVDEVCEKARAILANVKELREAAKGDEGVFKAGIDLLEKLDGKSLPPGWFVRVLADVKKLSVDELKNVRPGCGALKLHSVFNYFVDSTESVINGTDAGGLQNERIYRVPMKSFVGTLVLAKCGQRNMQSLSEALHGADGGQLLQTYRDFEGDDYVQYNLHGDEPVMTKMRMSVLAADRIKQLERFDILVAMAAGQNMENYEMIDEEMFDHGVEHPGYSHVVVDAIGGDFEDTVRANPDAYSPQ